MNAELTAEGVAWSVQARLVLDDVSACAPSGAITGLIGPNGSGKSSLLRCLAGLRSPTAGRVLVAGKPVGEHSRRELARTLAVVEQEAGTDVDLQVQYVVELGRTPHRRGWGPTTTSAGDDRAVAEAMRWTNTTHLASRRWQSLSGGERQRVQVARALTQEPSLLLLDEPTNHLDVRHQFELFAVLQALPATVVVALHDLPTAARTCDHLVVLRQGRVVTSGAPREVLTRDLVADVFGVEVQVTPRDDDHVNLTYTGLTAERPPSGAQHHRP